MRQLTFQSISIAMLDDREDGVLVFDRDTLVAVLSFLEGEHYDEYQGSWNLEIGFGRCGGWPMSFPDLTSAARWIAAQVGVDTGVAAAEANSFLKSHNF